MSKDTEAWVASSHGQSRPLALSGRLVQIRGVSPPARQVRHRYRDPLDEIWLRAAERVGLRVVRSEAVYATYDGQGTLTLATSDSFDADDSLAQMIFHELCHALVAGSGALRRVDWGLENVDARDLCQEHACHRLQAALADRYGLRAFFAVTTEHRDHWDALPADPLRDAGRAAAVEATALAREAFERACHGPWAGPLAEALEATARIAEVVRPHAASGSLWGQVRPLHASGFPVHADAGKTCGSCAWAYRGGPGRAALRCRQTRRGALPGVRVAAEAAACERWEARFGEEACGDCGACCREGFDLVPVGTREPLRRRHPEWLVRDGHRCHLPRPEGRCVALAGSGAPSDAYRCRVYAIRPRACRSFEVAGDACLEARRRTGLSR